jgi:hypothetical protein
MFFVGFRVKQTDRLAQRRYAMSLTLRATREAPCGLVHDEGKGLANIASSGFLHTANSVPRRIFRERRQARSTSSLRCEQPQDNLRMNSVAISEMRNLKPTSRAFLRSPPQHHWRYTTRSGNSRMHQDLRQRRSNSLGFLGPSPQRPGPSADEADLAPRFARQCG